MTGRKNGLGWPRILVRGLACLAALWSVAPLAASPRVVVSLKPLHALVAGVMAGVGTPALLVDGVGSPHALQLRPSDARRLQQADLVFWMGEDLELFLLRSLENVASKARVVALSAAPGLEHWPARPGGPWAHAHASDAGSGQGEDSGDAVLDLHVWLNVRNAARIVEHVTDELVRLDADNAIAYRANQAQLDARLQALDLELEHALATVRSIPFVVFHDAYQHLEQRYQLNAVGAVTVSPERRPSAKRLRELQETIHALGARCVFREPQFESALVATIMEGSDASVGTLDPLGVGLEPGVEAYFELMRANMHAIVECLRPDL